MPPAFATIRYKVYIIFGIFNLCMMIHAFFLFPETAGKTLEETEKMFEDPNGIRLIGTPAWKVSGARFARSSIEYGTNAILQTKVQYQHMAQMEHGAVPQEKMGSVAEHNEYSGDEKEKADV